MTALLPLAHIAAGVALIVAIALWLDQLGATIEQFKQDQQARHEDVEGLGFDLHGGNG